MALSAAMATAHGVETVDSRSALALLFAAGAALYLAAVRPTFGVTADDAYISLRYAANWAQGCGPVFNCGQPPVEGYTNFLWVAAAALAIRLGLDPVPTMRLLGLASGLAVLVLLFLLGRRLHGQSKPAGALALIALASSPFFAVNVSTGLETAAATASVLLAALLSLDLPTGRRPWAAGFAWGLAYLIRPEGLALGALTGLFALTRGLLERQGWRRTLSGCVRYAGALALVAGPLLVWRLVYYGSLFPNTFHAKRVPFSILLPRNYRLLASHALFFLTVLGAVALVLLVWHRRSARAWLVATLATGSAAISLSVHNNFWMPGHRLQQTSIALFIVLASGLAQGLENTSGVQTWRRAILSAIFLGLLLLSAWTVFPEMRTLSELHYARDDHPARRMGLAIRAQARPGDWLATRDAGMVPYFAGPGVHVLDIHEHSLNDARIARRGWDLGYILGHKPRFVIIPSQSGHDLVLSHPIEGQIVNHPMFRRDYTLAMRVPWHPTRHFFLYVRRGVSSE